VFSLLAIFKLKQQLNGTKQASTFTGNMPNAVYHLKFYKDSPEAMGELLTIKGFITPAAASSRKSYTGIADQEPFCCSSP
jgi:hypothetical protein